MWCIVSGSGSSATYMPGGFWSRTAPRISSRSSAELVGTAPGTPGRGAPPGPSGSGGRIESVRNMPPVVSARATGLSTRVPSRRDGVRRRSRSTAATSSWCRSPPSTPPSWPRRPPATVRRYGFTEVPDGVERDDALHRPPARPARRRRGRAVRPAARRRRAPRRLHPLHGAAPLARPGRAGRGRDRRHVAGAPTPSARRSTPRPSCCCSPTPSSVWRGATGGAGDRRPQRAQPRRRSSASVPASRACCATTARRSAPGEARAAP